jgi:hypothetical protein
METTAMGSKGKLSRMLGLSAPETMPEAALDDEGVIGVDVAPADEDLETGIAAVFEAIRNGDGGAAEDGDDSPPEDNGVTFALLTELNRLWDRSPA